MMLTLYDILGVSRDADGETLRKAYRQRVFHLHPDRTGNSFDSEAFRRINEAFQILSNPVTRAEYDLALSERRFYAIGAVEFVFQGGSEYAGLLAVLLLAPLTDLPSGMSFYFLFLFFLSLLGFGVLGLAFAQIAPRSVLGAVEWRAGLLGAVFALGWFVLNPFNVNESNERLFSLLMAVFVGSLLLQLIARTYLSRLLISLVLAIAIFLQFTGTYEDPTKISLSHTPKASSFIWLLSLGVFLSSIFSFRRPRDRK